jgi:phosphoribosylanthranilate isomerase
VSNFASAAEFVKICGVTNARDAEAVADAGADALGVILTTSSRRVGVEEARAVTDRVNGRLIRFAVVDSRDRESLDALFEGVGVDVVQVHGELSTELLAALRGASLGVVKALSIGTPEFATFDESLVDAVLVDGPVPGSGTAHSFAELGHRTFARPVIAAGGLTPESVAEVIDSLGVWGVDVSSGVESGPGLKDAQRVREFVDEARRSFEGRVRR